MIRASSLIAIALPAILLVGCTTLGGNVSGDFACRAPKGDCAPLGAIDARATAELVDGAASQFSQVRGGPARAEPGDLARTRERMLRIVFPAHVDAYGVFHDEAVAWTIAEPADWAARARSLPGEATPSALARAIADRLQTETRDVAPAQAPSPGLAEALVSKDLALFSEDPVLHLASPPSLPSTAREVIAGASAPGPEGFDTSDIRDRTPRSILNAAPLAWPSIDAIDAAHARGSQPPANADVTSTAQGPTEPRR